MRANWEEKRWFAAWNLEGLIFLIHSKRQQVRMSNIVMSVHTPDDSDVTTDDHPSCDIDRDPPMRQTFCVFVMSKQDKQTVPWSFKVTGLWPSRPDVADSCGHGLYLADSCVMIKVMDSNLSSWRNTAASCFSEPLSGSGGGLRFRGTHRSVMFKAERAEGRGAEVFHHACCSDGSINLARSTWPLFLSLSCFLLSFKHSLPGGLFCSICLFVIAAWLWQCRCRDLWVLVVTGWTNGPAAHSRSIPSIPEAAFACSLPMRTGWSCTCAVSLRNLTTLRCLVWAKRKKKQKIKRKRRPG